MTGLVHFIGTSLSVYHLEKRCPLLHKPYQIYQLLTGEHSSNDPRNRRSTAVTNFDKWNHINHWNVCCYNISVLRTAAELLCPTRELLRVTMKPEVLFTCADLYHFLRLLRCIKYGQLCSSCFVTQCVMNSAETQHNRAHLNEISVPLKYW
jgi:hypothetical protein